jgi:hypothetical protein
VLTTRSEDVQFGESPSSADNRSSIWRRYVTSNCRTFSEIHGQVAHKAIFFIIHITAPIIDSIIRWDFSLRQVHILFPRLLMCIYILYIIVKTKKVAER